MEISFIHVQPLVHLHANKTNFRMKGCTRTRFETDAKVNSEMDYSHLHTHARMHARTKTPSTPHPRHNTESSKEVSSTRGETTIWSPYIILAKEYIPEFCVTA